MAKSILVTFSEDPTESPNVLFEGEWNGRDISIAEAQIRRGYRLRKRDFLRGGYTNGASGESGSSGGSTGSSGEGTEPEGTRVVAVSGTAEDKD